jgi:tetratricopeptide (TPR) repeat protein
VKQPDPGPFDKLMQRAQALLAQGALRELTGCLAEARKAATGNAAAQAALAEFHFRREDLPAALQAWDAAVQLAPHHAVFRFNRATIRRFLGQLDAAEEDLDAVIAARPGDAEAWHLRSDLRTQTADRNHLAELQAHAAKGFAQWPAEVAIRYALAKELEDLGRYEESWRELSAGASLRRRHLQYDVRADVETVNWIRKAYPDAVAHGASVALDGPIFILGMPRTGTTLLERIVARHPDVQAAGELPHLANALVAATQAAAGRANITRPELVAASAHADFAGLAVDYRRRCAPHARGKRFFIDKLPLNYLYCGIIRRALPGSRILHLTRHPIATGYAVYKTLFAQGYPFSYDLGEIAAYYTGYRQLMDHWHATLPGQVLDVPYENLVCDPLGEGRRVFEFCGLTWQDDYAEVQRDSGISMTASASQVRRPIYQSSIDLWRHSESQLQPLAQRLASFL